MTLDEAILTLYETLGEPTDFNPYASDWVTLDPASKGYGRLKDLLNSGQTACANFKPDRGAQIRFTNLIANTNVKVNEISAPFDVDNNDLYKIYINKADLPNPGIAELSTSGRFTNSFITIYDVVYTVDFDSYDLDNSRWAINLNTPVDRDATLRVATLNKNSFLFLPSSHPWVGENFREPATISYGVGRGNLTYVLKINNITDQEELTKGSIGEDFLFTSTDFDTPREYILLGREIKFDTVPPADLRLSIDYYRTPSKLESGDEVFEIPEQFHYGIIMWATWQGLVRVHELETSRLFKQDYAYFMRTTKNDNDYRWERTEDGSGTIRSK